jgi:hydroxymethylpyrimidine/phosphomethylpyrimidine kinase
MTENEEIMMLGMMWKAIEIIEECREFAMLIPEVRSNLVYAKHEAKTVDDVMAIDGRITIVNGRPHASGHPKFGASSHMARIILELMKFNPEIRSGINITCNPELISFLEDYCAANSMRIVKVDRTNEPAESRDIEGKTMSWKAREAVRLAGGDVPDIFYETGDIGKEPIITVVGKNPVEVVTHACDIAMKYSLIKK